MLWITNIKKMSQHAYTDDSTKLKPGPSKNLPKEIRPKAVPPFPFNYNNTFQLISRNEDR